jgi:hypothetical protein
VYSQSVDGAISAISLLAGHPKAHRQTTTQAGIKSPSEQIESLNRALAVNEASRQSWTEDFDGRRNLDNGRYILPLRQFALGKM